MNLVPWPRPVRWFFRYNPESELFGTWIAKAITLGFILWMAWIAFN